MTRPLLTQNFDAGAAIAKRRIVKFDASDHTVIQAAASTDALMGVADYGADASGDRVDVHVVGEAPVEYGGSVTRGNLLTSDAGGKAVEAAPASGVNASVIGRATISGNAGDIGSALLAPSQIQG